MRGKTNISNDLLLPNSKTYSLLLHLYFQYQDVLRYYHGVLKSVDYLSPHELRNDLEVILGMHGRKGLSKQNIKTNYPVLFYNLVWYCNWIE